MENFTIPELIRGSFKFEIKLMGNPSYPVIMADATPSEFVKWCLVSNKMCRDNNQQLRMIYGK